MTNNKMIKSPITDEDLKRLTFGQLIRSLSIGAWLWIISLLCIIIGFSYRLGYNSGVFQSPNNKQQIALETLSNNQMQLVRKIWRYQKSHNLNKVIIKRNGFIFDDVEIKETTINLAEEILGNREEYEFEKLILSIPIYFLKQIPEARLNSPYVVTIPEEARKILDKD